MDWKQTLARWRALPEAERVALRWRRIPQNVAESMAFEGEPVNLSWLEELHRQAAPPAILRPNKAS